MMTTTATAAAMSPMEPAGGTKNHGRTNSSSNRNAAAAANTTTTIADNNDEPPFQQQHMTATTTETSHNNKSSDGMDVVLGEEEEEEATWKKQQQEQRPPSPQPPNEDQNSINHRKILQFRQDLLGSSAGAAAVGTTATTSTTTMGGVLHDRAAQETVLQQTCLLADGRQQDTTTTTTSNNKLILITGASGTGKTYLATRALQHMVEVQQGGYFCAGKFQGRRVLLEPYQAFVGALTAWTQAVLERGDAAQMRNLVWQAVGGGEDEVTVLTSVIPALERILYTTTNDATTTTRIETDDTNHGKNNNNKEAMIQRFVFVFRSFLQAISSPEKPLVLLLDDLQLADPCSLDLLKYIIMTPATTTASDGYDGNNNGGLVVIGTCDDTAVSVDSYLSKTLREMEASDDDDNKDGHNITTTTSTITHIPIHNFSATAIANLLARVMHTESSSCEALAKLVHDHTQQGNPFYVSQLVQELQERGLLYLDSMSRWTWNVDDIRKELQQQQQKQQDMTTLQPRTVQDFLADKIDRQLDQQTKEVLKVASCFGSSVEATPIEHVLGYSVSHCLELACEKGFLVVDKATGRFAFNHDGIRESVYRLIPENERELFHLEIGRRLWRKLERDDLDRRLFSVLSQFKLGKRLISRENERVALASLCFHAGRKAARSSTFRMAAVYLNFGIELIGERGWRNEYELTLALYNAGAEMCMCCADFKRMDELVDAVLKHSRIPLDRVQAQATRMYVLGSTDRQQEAIDLGIEVLKDFDEYFPNRLCRAHLLSEWNSVRKLLKGKSDEQLMRRPTLHDPKKLACLRILELMFLNCLFSRPKMTPYVTLKTMKITMQHGLSPISSTAFASYALVCLGGGDDDGAVRFAQLGMKLLDQSGTTAYLPRVYAAYYGVVYAWRYPITGTLEPLMRAYRVGLQSGDSEFAYLCYNCFCSHTFCAGRPLGTVMRYWSAVKESMVDSKKDTMVKLVLPFIQTIKFFMDESEGDALSFKGTIMDLVEQEQQDFDSGRKSNAIEIRFDRMMIAYTFDDYEAAYSLTDIFRDIRQAVPTIALVSCYFLRGMICLEIARKGKDVRKKIHVAKTTIKMLKRWATKSPHNVLDKKFTLEAEFASFCGQPDKAYEKFTCAIALAKDACNLHIQAIAEERLGYHLLRLDQKESAEASLRRAIQLYDEWQGRAKARSLEKKVNSIFVHS